MRRYQNEISTFRSSQFQNVIATFRMAPLNLDLAKLARRTKLTFRCKREGANIARCFDNSEDVSARNYNGVVRLILRLHGRFFSRL